MNIILRPGHPADASACGEICYEAFKDIAGRHNFPPDFPDAATATGLMNYLFSEAGVWSVVAESDGQILGSNFLWEDVSIGGVGPITVDPGIQNISVGRKLMERVLQHVQERKLAGVRLVQAAYHNRSLSLYTKLGFDVREPLAQMQGASPGTRVPGYNVRPAKEIDLDSCNQLCFGIHGHTREYELHRAIAAGTASVAEKDGRITGYSTQVGFFGHTLAESNDGLKAIIGASASFSGPGFLLPSRNAEMLRWCLDNRLRIVQPMTLMSKGFYQEPAGAFLPSVLY
jgi:GNAT superfamily N-acetyltransferase